MFKAFKKQVQQQFEKLAKGELFYVTIDRDKIFETYLNGFPEGEERQGNNCNCCKSFLRQWGGIVGIDKETRKMVSIWDFEEGDEEYENARANLSGYIHSLPITDVFVNGWKNCGTDSNFDMADNVTWEHFYITLPGKFVKSIDTIDSYKGQRRTTREMLERVLMEISIDTTETILELIGQNSLYKGKEFEGTLKKFLVVQKEFKTVPEDEKTNWLWLTSLQVEIGISRIRNTAIGTLLINLSEGMELDLAVTKYEQVVAPNNYKRTTALTTPKMVEAAQKKLKELGLLESLDRRFATEADLNINNLLFTDKTVKNLDVFGEIIQEGPVNPKTLSKIETITISEFIEKVVPTCKTIEVLVENSHLNNLVSIVTSKTPDVPSLFKWNNNFSWAYIGDITDSMKERVKAAGGKVDGVLRFSIQWNENNDSHIDLDAHAYEPNGIHIYYSSGYRKDRENIRTPQTGQLDVDIVSPGNKVAVENISWIDRSKMKDGVYKFSVHNFSGHKNFKGFRAEIEFDGEIHEFGTDKPYTGFKNVAEVTLNKGVFTIKSLMDSKTSISSKEKWNIKTNIFHKVDKMMLSPNYWNSTTGNKHYFFMLKDCKADEAPRPFFNEFLKTELNENRKVFEIVGAKLKIEPSDKQLSGIGFSETQPNHLIVRIEGKFKRTLKVTI